MAEQSQKLERYFPNLDYLNDPKLKREILVAFTRIYDYFEDKIRTLENQQEIRKTSSFPTPIPLEILDSRVLNNSNNLKVETSGAPYTNVGLVTIFDNAGNTVSVMVGK